jgi:hypothetical protein
MIVQYCQYAGGPCDREPVDSRGRTFFLFASTPREIASTIETAVTKLQQMRPKSEPSSWKHLDTPGQIIFCEICRGIREAATVIADVTTLNFNVLFELGFAVGLGLPTVPIRDTSFGSDRKLFDQLGMLDTLGYLDFSDSDGLARGLADRLPGKPLPFGEHRPENTSPLYVLKAPIPTDGATALLSAIKKSGIKFRAFDPSETSRLPLAEAHRQVAKSLGMMAHLLGPQRGQDGLVHDARCAIVAGLALAQEQVVTLFDGSASSWPIDYRDIIVTYSNLGQIKQLLEEPVRTITDRLQSARPEAERHPVNLLARIDLGDMAAENEQPGLREYFVPTGQSNQARRGHARLVIGRKGSGKTAIFYDVRNSVFPKRKSIVLDLMPEGHQFLRLKEVVLERLSAGLQEHTMVAFWNYVLLIEIARKILRTDQASAYRDPEVLNRYEHLKNLCDGLEGGVNEDFSQRLLSLMARLAEAGKGASREELGDTITKFLYSNEIVVLAEAVGQYVAGEKESVWLLVDNLDKGWPVKGADATDIVVVHSLLEATRKLQRSFDDAGIDFKCLVFLRTDIYEHLLRETRDKGKDTPIRLDQFDQAVFEQIVRSRITASAGVETGFAALWSQLAESHIGSEDSFTYIVDRTLMRPRDLLMFLQTCVEVALNRGHSRIHAEDILQAERSYSYETLFQTAAELENTNPICAAAMLEFRSAQSRLTPGTVVGILREAGMEDDLVGGAIELLVWFGFLGVTGQGFTEDTYSHSVQFNMRALMQPVEKGHASFVIHPAFHRALEIRT